MQAYCQCDRYSSRYFSMQLYSRFCGKEYFLLFRIGAVGNSLNVRLRLIILARLF